MNTAATLRRAGDLDDPAIPGLNGFRERCSGELNTWTLREHRTGTLAWLEREENKQREFLVFAAPRTLDRWYSSQVELGLVVPDALAPLQWERDEANAALRARGPRARAVDWAGASEAELRSLGHALARIHGAEVDVDAEPSSIEMAGALRGWVARARELAPTKATEWERVGARLARACGRLLLCPSAVVHDRLEFSRWERDADGGWRTHARCFGRGYAELALGSLAIDAERHGLERGQFESVRTSWEDASRRRADSGAVALGRAWARFSDLDLDHGAPESWSEQCRLVEAELER